MRTARESLVRGLVLVYLSVLWLAVLPRNDLPVLGTAERSAAALLRTAGVLPGIGVFPGASGPWKLYAECISVVGRRPDGATQQLYPGLRHDCPPRGAIWLHDGWDAFIAQAMRNVEERRLLRAPEKIPAGTRVPEDIRRVLMLGDYFCHSPLAGPADFTEVLLDRVQYQRHYETGELDQLSMVCRFVCNPAEIVVPDCHKGTRRRIS